MILHAKILQNWFLEGFLAIKSIIHQKYTRIQYSITRLVQLYWWQKLFKKNPFKAYKPLNTPTHACTQKHLLRKSLDVVNWIIKKIIICWGKRLIFPTFFANWTRKMCWFWGCCFFLLKGKVWVYVNCNDQYLGQLAAQQGQCPYMAKIWCFHFLRCYKYDKCSTLHDGSTD